MCGIVGVVNQNREAIFDIIIGLDALQHRGKETAGAAVSHAKLGLRSYVAEGKVQQVFLPFRDWANNLPGDIGIGHTRYSTSSVSSLANAQPVSGVFRGKPFSLAHNGNLVNLKVLREILGKNPLFDSISDTRLCAKLIESSGASTFASALLEVLPILQGAFCFVALYEGALYAARDRFGFHPLQLAQRGKDFLVASESCVFSHLEADFIREVEPGEIVVIAKDGFHPMRWAKPAGLKFDIFEYIYFLRPDSTVYGVNAELARRRMGHYLAQEHPIDADLVISIPSSGDAATFGYYERMRELGYRIRFDPRVLFRPHAERTFIGPNEKARRNTIRLKFTVIAGLLRGIRRMAVGDDSLVRGATRQRTTALLKSESRKVNDNDLGLEVCGLNSSPPYMFPDFYGIDTYRDKDELIVPRLNGDLDAVAQELGLDYLGYLSLDSVIRAVLDCAPSDSPLTRDSFYTAPFTGIYPDGKGDF